MKPSKSLGIAFFITCLALTAHAQTPWETLIAAEAAHEKIPVLSTLLPGLDTVGAMEIQKRYVAGRLHTDKIAGFKAGLTAKKARERFGLSAPVAGVLFQSGRRDNQAVIDSVAFHRPMIETEIGFVLGRPLSGNIKDRATLIASVSEVLPVIELPDLGFADMKALKGVDIMAANVSARQFITGTAVPLGKTDLNAVEVILYRDGEAVNSGKGSDALGDQWQALLWLANAMTEQGYVLVPGQVLITGALGKMVPGKPGAYRADYGDFGSIVFEIR